MSINENSSSSIVKMTNVTAPLPKLFLFWNKITAPINGIKITAVILIVRAAAKKKAIKATLVLDSRSTNRNIA
jgi:hypothetical protein